MHNHRLHALKHAPCTALSAQGITGSRMLPRRSRGLTVKDRNALKRPPFVDGFRQRKTIRLGADDDGAYGRTI